MPKNCGVGWPEKVVSCSEDEKGVQGGSGAYMNQVQRFSRGISGLVVEYIVAIDVTRMSAWTASQLTCRFCRRHFGRAAKASAC